MDRNVEMFMQIEKALVQTSILTRPAIYLQQSMDKILGVKMKDIVKRHQGTLVEKSDDATHVVHQLPSQRDEGEYRTCAAFS